MKPGRLGGRWKEPPLASRTRPLPDRHGGGRGTWALGRGTTPRAAESTGRSNHDQSETLLGSGPTRYSQARRHWEQQSVTNHWPARRRRHGNPRTTHNGSLRLRFAIDGNSPPAVCRSLEHSAARVAPPSVNEMSQVGCSPNTQGRKDQAWQSVQLRRPY